jgi:hypothetical protein
MRRFIPVVALALVLTTVACDNSGSSASLSNSSTTSPSLTLTTETFSGIVAVGGTDFKLFTAAQAGEVDVTLTAAGPPSTIFMGLGVGAPGATGLTCELFPSAMAPVQAATTPQLAGTVNAGTYCVEVYDIGNQAAPVSYTVTVAHP